MSVNTLDNLWRLYIMTRKTESLLKGMGAGLAVGIAAGVAGTALMSNKNKGRKFVDRAVGKIEDVIDNVQQMLG